MKDKFTGYMATDVTQRAGPWPDVGISDVGKRRVRIEDVFGGSRDAQTE